MTKNKNKYPAISFESKLRAVVILLSFFVTIGMISAQPNTAILDSMMQLSASNICSQLSGNSAKEMEIFVPDHPAKAMLINKIITNKACSGIKFIQQNNYNIISKSALILAPVNISVEYQNHSEYKDSLIRVITIDYSVSLRNADNKITPLTHKPQTYKDVYSRKEAVSLATSAGGFAHPIPPEPKKTFFEEIAEPAIVITSAIVTILLLFTVRSN